MPRIILAYLIDLDGTRSSLVEVEARDELWVDGRRYLFSSIDAGDVPVYLQVPMVTELSPSADHDTSDRPDRRGDPIVTRH
jgi:hypothetical protein